MRNYYYTLSYSQQYSYLGCYNHIISSHVFQVSVLLKFQIKHFIQFMRVYCLLFNLGNITSINSFQEICLCDAIFAFFVEPDFHFQELNSQLPGSQMHLTSAFIHQVIILKKISIVTITMNMRTPNRSMYNHQSLIKIHSFRNEFKCVRSYKK